ncbi:hypothetical protein [Gracilibacillus sp. YIM 98692]|uniref:hypothetical protein n=1 Tax=Gracilibacillus sp. YIM 98692 TaxID=2663532 RepID=UPI0013D4A1DB|nr:hypothetical protein [Gracilibacillus sp. YIM 98692]
MRKRELEKRFSLESMRDKESRRIAVKVYDDHVGHSFVYYENEIKNLGEKMPDLQRFIELNWRDIENGKYEVEAFNQFEVID